MRLKKPAEMTEKKEENGGERIPLPRDGDGRHISDLRTVLVRRDNSGIYYKITYQIPV